MMLDILVLQHVFHNVFFFLGFFIITNSSSSLLTSSISCFNLSISFFCFDMFMNGSMKSNVCFCFQNPILIDKNTIEMRLSVVNAQLPISWYLINSNNNQIIITINSISTTYYFKQGNYNINSFITEWNNSIGTGWTLTFDNITNKIKFLFTSNFIFSDNNLNTIFPIIGFNSGTTYTSLSSSLISPFCINFAGLTSLK